MKRLLIISNNVLSYTNNNGKTLLSFFDGVEDLSVSQLYLSGEIPKVIGYRYFQISDKDIINGMMRKSKRGRSYDSINNLKEKDDYSIRNAVGRNDITLIARDLLWYNKWKSPQLFLWLKDINPDIILFVAGDSLFAYSICDYIQKKYKSRLCLYITDDYIMPRKKERILHFFRRKSLVYHLKHTLEKTNILFTISEKMRIAYKKVLNKDSIAIFNIAPKREQVLYPENKKSSVVFTYAGSLYYKREDSLIEVAKTIQNINKREGSRALLQIYSNNNPSEKSLDKMNLNNTSKFCGFVNSTELQKVMANSDVLVFVESFETEQIEKTRLSLSTKISEYLSMGKPILAVGPKEVGSMEFLEGVAAIVTDLTDLDSIISKLVNDQDYRTQLSKKSIERYNSLGTNDDIRKKFILSLLG